MRLIIDIEFIEFFAGNFNQTRAEGIGVGFLLEQVGFDSPVFLGHKRQNLALTLDHEADGDGLDASSRQATPHPLPQYPRQTITHQAIENAAGLLGIDKRHIDVAGIGDGLFDGVGGNFAE